MFQRLTPSAFSWRRRSAGSNCQASVPAAAASVEAARLTAFDNGCASLHGEVRIAGGIDQNGGVNPDESAFGGYEDRLNGIVFRFAGDKRGVEHQLHTGFSQVSRSTYFRTWGAAMLLAVPSAPRAAPRQWRRHSRRHRRRLRPYQKSFLFDSERCNCIYRNFHLCRFYSD